MIGDSKYLSFSEIMLTNLPIINLIVVSVNNEVKYKSHKNLGRMILFLNNHAIVNLESKH
ncbi:hypothetical protein DRN98_10080 [Methanosarcinales archaeon]|nr:MAG: hypothetical protein DRN98_10080 [Methanosarcinales archaeon]